MSNGIATRQNEDNSIAMLAAQRQLYRDAKKFNTVLVALSVWIPFQKTKSGNVYHTYYL